MGPSTLEKDLNSTKGICTCIDTSAYAEFKTKIRFQISLSVAEISPHKLFDFRQSNFGRVDVCTCTELRGQSYRSR